MKNAYFANHCGSSLIVVVIIMSMFLAGIALALSTATTSYSMLAASRANEQEATYLAENAVNRMIMKMNKGDLTAIAATQEPSLTAGRFYEASYDASAKPFGIESGTVIGKGYIMDPQSPGTPLYTKTIYYGVVGSSAPLMVYFYTSPEGYENIPHYRTWNGTSWSERKDAPPVIGGIYTGVYTPHIEFITLTFDPGSNHAMLGMEDKFGNFWAEEWNGAEFSNPTLVCDSGGTGTRTMDTRAFDISYENAATNGTHRAIFVFDDENATVNEPLYSIWNGSSWSTTGVATNHLTVATVPGTMTQPYFIETATNPSIGSKGIGMIYQDSNKGVFGEVWDGTSWSTMGQNASWGTVNTNTNRTVTLAYVQVSPYLLLFGYGNGGVGNSRTWNGTALANPLQVTANNNTVRWMDFKAIPSSNTILAFYETSANKTYELYSSTFTATTWSGTRIDHGKVYNDYTIPYFGFASTGSGKGTLFYSTNTGTLARKTWSGGTTWSTATTVSGWTRSYVTVTASPQLGATFAAFYENVANNDISVWNTDNTGVWQGASPSPNIETGITLKPAYERIVIAVPVANGTGAYIGIPGTWREAY